MDKNVKESKKESLQYYKEEICKLTNEIENIKEIKMIYGFIKKLHNNWTVKSLIN